MSKVFISGCVSDATLHGPMRGLNVQASVSDGSDQQVLWQGKIDADGAFGFELRPSDYPQAQYLLVELHDGQAQVAESKVEWRKLEQGGAHVELKITEHVLESQSQAAYKPLSLPFPIGFPGANRPPKQRGPVTFELKRPAFSPTHPMAALPFLIQHSRPSDPEEAVKGDDDTRRFVTRTGPGSDPP